MLAQEVHGSPHELHGHQFEALLLKPCDNLAPIVENFFSSFITDTTAKQDPVLVPCKLASNWKVCRSRRRHSVLLIASITQWQQRLA